MRTFKPEGKAVATAVLLVGAALCTFIAYFTYYGQVMDDVIRSNRWSWSIWSVATLVEAATYDAVNTDFWKSSIFFLSAGLCVLVTFAVWRRLPWESPKLGELFCVGAVIAALVLWLQYQLAWWAHVVMVLAVFVSFIPAWMEAWKEPEHERPLAWFLWSLGDFLTLLVILVRFEKFENLPYILAEFGCHYLMLLIVVWRRQGA